MLNANANTLKSPVAVYTATIEKDQGNAKHRFFGQARSNLNITVNAPVGGRLVTVPQVGDVVEKGQLLVKIEDKFVELELAEARALKESSILEVNYYQSELERLNKLSEQRHVSEKDFESIQLKLELSQANAKLTDAKLKKLEFQLKQTSIKAPFLGVVAKVYRPASEEALLGDNILSFVSNRVDEVHARVSVEHADWLDVGSKANIYSRGSISSAVVAGKYPSNFPHSQSFNIKLKVAETAIHQLVEGEFVDVEVLNEQRGVAEYRVHRDAVNFKDGKAGIYIISENSKAKRVSVDIVREESNFVLVQGKLDSNMKIIVRGLKNVENDAEVNNLGSIEL